MSKYPGENLLVTLFGDVHYYITPPSSRPPHDRFDKGSYVYIYRHANTGRGRLEIANNPGTPEVDSFFGFLDKTYTQWTHKQPCLVTVTVTSPPGQPPAPAEDQEWRLPTPDPNNNGRYMYKLNTIDVYFWTPEDAQNFINQLKAIVSPQSLQLIGAPAPAAQLAFPPPPGADPSLQRTESTAPSTAPSTAGGIPPPPPIGSTIPGPPGGPPPGGPIGGAASKKDDAKTDYTPLAYNPAAPPKPETLVYRPKTPPPSDGDIGLAAAAAKDSHPGGVAPPPSQPSVGLSSFGGLGPAAGGPVFSGPPKPATSPPQGALYGQSPPPPTGSASSYGSPYVPPPPPGQPAAPNTFGQPSYGPTPTQYGGYPQSTQTPPTSYPGYTPPPPQGQQPQGQGPAQPAAHDVHNQFYQPGAGEGSAQPAQQSSGKPSELARFEKGFNKFLKNLEKKVG